MILSLVFVLVTIAWRSEAQTDSEQAHWGVCEGFFRDGSVGLREWVGGGPAPDTGGTLPLASTHVSLCCLGGHLLTCVGHLLMQRNGY